MMMLLYLQLWATLFPSGVEGTALFNRQDPGLAQCRQNFTTDVWTLCADVLAQFHLSLDQFTAMNPDVGEVCGGFVPGEPYCVARYAEHNFTVSEDGSCGWQATVLSTCVGSEFGDCCGAEGRCGSGEEFCGIGNCQEGECLGGGPYSTDGRCGRTVNYVPCPPRFGLCCSQDGLCGNDTLSCGAGCQYGNCISTTTTTSSSTRPTPTNPPGSISRDGTCGYARGFVCEGSTYGGCCSAAGYCGSTEYHCSELFGCRLAPELLTRILDCVHQSNSGGGHDLAACSSVCKQWDYHARPILYRHIALDASNMERFLDTFDRQTDPPYTHSLTFRLSYPILVDWDEGHGNYYAISYRLLDRWLRRFAEVIPFMTKLAALSLSVVPNESCKLLRPTIAAILQALPPACVDLELDTNGHDSDNIENEFEEPSVTEDSLHLCGELRAILPRLQHSRINLRFICGALVGNYGELGFEPIEMPVMKQLLVNCRRHWSISKRCPQAISMDEAGSTSWHSVIHGLRHVVDRGGLRPGAEAIVLAQTGGDSRDQAQVRALLRCDVAERATWAFPMAFPARPSFEGKTVYYVRTHKGGFIANGTGLLQDILEDYSWRTTKNGARLPRHRIGDIRVQDFDVVPEAEWRSLWPRLSCTLWTNEKETGLRLIEAEKRTGEPGMVNSYDELRGLVESTPDGWYRPMSMDRALLERVDRSE
ncbi:hypothetical protein S40293_08001 [Stachybotrys chartarum IBT 40293]|nr:hypothetical protein S40293_08001 [Stachybotrys chartarum IBT 40293]